MKYLVVTIFLFFIVLQGCKNKDNDSQVITLDLTGKLSSEPFNLNEHVTDLKMVRLETNENSLIRYFRGHAGEKFIINIDNDKVILFSSTGKYIRTITQKGNGPHEFKQIDAWTVDKDETHFLFHDRYKNYIFNFNLNSLQFERDVPFEEHGYLSKMILVNDSILSVLPAMFAEYGYLFFNQTISGHITGGVIKENVPHPGAWAGRSPLFKLSPDNSIIFQPSEVDTIFRIDGAKMTPVYALKLEEPVKSGDKTTGTFVSYLYSNDNRILFSKSGYESIVNPNNASMTSTGQEFISYDLKTLQTSKIDLITLDNIVLNFDGANVSFPKKNHILLSYQAFELKKMIDETIKSKDLTETDKERLESLNSEISENDNPIVIIGRLK